jgi:hypothetical protein
MKKAAALSGMPSNRRDQAVGLIPLYVQPRRRVMKYLLIGSLLFSGALFADEEQDRAAEEQFQTQKLEDDRLERQRVESRIQEQKREDARLERQRVEARIQAQKLEDARLERQREDRRREQRRIDDELWDRAHGR